ncbi:MAG: chloride channel protein [Proteobacteria bacterium]|nr:chloride channel protein [Pseudomonadota bacterium]
MFKPAFQTVRLWLWAAVAGALGAVSTIGFRWLTQQVEWVATGHKGGLVEAAMALPAWHRALVCAVGGLLAGTVLALGSRWAAKGKRGDRNLDYIEATRAGRVDLNDRTTLTRTVSALFSIGTGASIGREGPMVQLAAWVGSWLARWVAVSPEQRNIIMVCGIASGIGSAYHAPIAGVVFVLELALGFLATNTVAPVLIACSTAAALIYWLIDPAPLYVISGKAIAPAGLGVALLSGIVFGGIGWLWLRLLDKSRELFSRVSSMPLRLGLGGVLVGLISAAVPEVWGNGYSVASQVLQGQHVWQWLAVILAAKVVATALSSGSGAIGGVFTPSLFVGAAAGSMLAQLAAMWMPMAGSGDPRTLAVVGMAAVLAAVTHAPLMSIVMVLEMTDQFQLTVPIMLACGVAHATSTQFGAKPIYGNPIEGRK